MSQEPTELGYNEAGMKQAGKRLVLFFLLIGIIFGLLILLLGLHLTGICIMLICGYLFRSISKKGDKK